jgi:hypothetical protein
MLTRNRNSILLIRLGNVFLASLAFLFLLMGEAGCHSALSSRPPRLHHGPITVREIAVDLIVFFWFIGAIGLFSHKRFAWIGSLIGTGTSACILTMFWVMIVRWSFFPDANTELNKDVGLFTKIFVVGEVSVPLAISWGLFIGLLLMRKALR